MPYFTIVFGVMVYFEITDCDIELSKLLLSVSSNIRNKMKNITTKDININYASANYNSE